MASFQSPNALLRLTCLVATSLSIPGARAIRSTLYYPESTFFSTSFQSYYSTLNIRESDGDLWPTAWADDDVLYAANGDGRGFSANPDDFRDAVVNKIFGTPETGITGERLAAGDELGPIWADEAVYNRKPTGIVAVDGDGDGKDELYLVIQALNYSPEGNRAFNDVPAASIIRSTDYGITWSSLEAPMFSDYIFTTVWFLDFGKSNQHASVLGEENSRYVYAYGLDNNWRDSVPNTVPDPQDLWLARAPVSSIQNITSWEWFSGTSDSPSWSSTLSDRQPVLHDERRVYAGGFTEDGFSVLSQGSVVYNAPMRRYIYTSWTDYTFDYYEAPNPWGPWELFEWKDFGVTPWFGLNQTNPKNGGYATVVPSKFISEDGLKMWVQSNWFVGAAEGSDWNYCFSLRELWVNKYEPSEASNEKSSPLNLAMEEDAVPVCKAAHYGNLDYLNDGQPISEDSWDGSKKEIDRWGFIWPRSLNINRVVYTTGGAFDDGGWFMANLTVQVRQDFEWSDVNRLQISPEYPFDSTAVPNKVYELTFDDVVADGVQIIGVPGGDGTFTSIGELQAFFD